MLYYRYHSTVEKSLRQCLVTTFFVEFRSVVHGYQATQSRFADYRHHPHAIWKILFIIHYLYEFAQIIQTFNIAVSKTFVSP